MGDLRRQTDAVMKTLFTVLASHKLRLLFRSHRMCHVSADSREAEFCHRCMRGRTHGDDIIGHEIYTLIQDMQRIFTCLLASH